MAQQSWSKRLPEAPPLVKGHELSLLQAPPLPRNWLPTSPLTSRSRLLTNQNPLLTTRPRLILHPPGPSCSLPRPRPFLAGVLEPAAASCTASLSPRAERPMAAADEARRVPGGGGVRTYWGVGEGPHGDQRETSDRAGPRGGCGRRGADNDSFWLFPAPPTEPRIRGIPRGAH